MNYYGMDYLLAQKRKSKREDRIMGWIGIAAVFLWIYSLATFGA